MEQMKELEKQKGNLKGSTTSFLLVIKGEIRGSGWSGSREAREVQSKGENYTF